MASLIMAAMLAVGVCELRHSRRGRHRRVRTGTRRGTVTRTTEIFLVSGRSRVRCLPLSTVTGALGLGEGRRETVAAGFLEYDRRIRGRVLGRTGFRLMRISGRRIDTTLGQLGSSVGTYNLKRSALCSKTGCFRQTVRHCSSRGVRAMGPCVFRSVEQARFCRNSSLRLLGSADCGKALCKCVCSCLRSTSLKGSG